MMGMQQGQNVQLTLLEQIEGGKSLLKSSEMSGGMVESQLPVECDEHARPMMMLLVPHSSGSEISMGTTMCDMDGTGITSVTDHHGMMGISSPMQKNLSYYRISTSVTSKLLSRVSKEDRRNQPSLMDCGKVYCSTNSLTSGRSSMTTTQSCLPTAMPSCWGMRPNSHSTGHHPQGRSWWDPMGTG